MRRPARRSSRRSRPRGPYPVISSAVAAGTSEPLADAAAIALLEEQVIPWQDSPDGAQIRRLLRQKPAKNPLVAAEKVFRRSARPGAPGSGEGSPAGEFARQGRQILGWARRRARLIDRSVEDRLAALGGVEHEVYLDDASQRWLKLTMPGRGGKELQVREDGFGVRPTLATEDALISNYLRRLLLANEYLGDDFWLHGVIPHPEGPRLVISQRDIEEGRALSIRDIARHFAQAGYVEVNEKTYYHPARNLLISDAHVGNVLHAREGIVPFDVCVQEPHGSLRRAVEPSPVLDFDDRGDEQSALL